MSSSSSSSRSQYVDAPQIPLCDCRPPGPARERLSWSQDNPARRFYNCVKSMGSRQTEKYGYFDWIDHEVNEHYRRMLHRLRNNANAQVVELAEKNLAAAQMKLVVVKEKLVLVKGKRVSEKVIAAVDISQLKMDNQSLKNRVKLLIFIAGLLVVGVGVLFVKLAVR